MSVRRKVAKTTRRIITIIRKLLTYNITTIMFGALLLYMIVTLVLYATTPHITSYQVTVGPLTKNPVCTALAVREEQIVSAESSGYMEYYAHEGMQVRKGGSVYALNNAKKHSENLELSEEQLAKMRSSMSKFSYGFDNSDFYDTYSFKYEMQGSILQAAGVRNMDETGRTASDTTEEGDTSDTPERKAVKKPVQLGRQTFYTAPEAGVVVYSMDGYETKTADALEEEDFNQKSYKKTELLTSKQVKKGNPVYKVITSENWSLMVPLTEKLAATIADRESIKVKFIKDGESHNGALSIVNVGGQKVARIDLKNGMARYASDRFLEIELVVNTRSGLKIPVSAIVTKEFFLIPRDFLSKGDNEERQGFIREIRKKGASDTEFVRAEIYREVDEEGEEISWDTAGKPGGYCYVDKKSFQEGDILRKPDSGETFVVGEVDYLEGVYGMNKGYAIFCQIKVLDQNEEYCIVDQRTSYGLQPFDYIVLDGESVDEEDILHAGVH